jgi:hypothetical protein
MNWLADIIAGSPATRLSFSYVFRPGPGLFIGLAVWQIATFLALQLFYESKHRAGVTWRHLLRVFVHSTAPASMGTVLWFALELLVDASLFVHPWVMGMRIYDRLGLAVFWSLLLVTWIHLGIGLGRHLRIPHGWAVGAAALWIGYLTMRAVRLMT